MLGGKAFNWQHKSTPLPSCQTLDTIRVVDANQAFVACHLGELAFVRHRRTPAKRCYLGCSDPSLEGLAPSRCRTQRRRRLRVLDIMSVSFYSQSSTLKHIQQFSTHDLGHHPSVSFFGEDMYGS